MLQGRRNKEIFVVLYGPWNIIGEKKILVHHKNLLDQIHIDAHS